MEDVCVVHCIDKKKLLWQIIETLPPKNESCYNKQAILNTNTAFDFPLVPFAV